MKLRSFYHFSLICIALFFSGIVAGQNMNFNTEKLSNPLDVNGSPTDNKSTIFTIGTGTYLLPEAPVNARRKYSFSQTLYLKSELTFGNKAITQVAYKYGGNKAELVFEIEIWIGHTSLSQLSGTVQLTNSVKVYDGGWSCAAGQQYSIVTIDPFIYNNVDNLLITVIEKHQSSGSTTDKFYSTAVPAGKKYCFGTYRSTSPYDPTNLPSSTNIAYRANIWLWVDDLPVGPAVSEITPANLDFGQVETGEYKDLKATVKNIGADPLIVTGFNSTNPNFTIQNVTFPFTLNMLQQKTIDVRYESVTPGTEQAVITLEMDPMIAGTKEIATSAESVVPQVVTEFPYFEGFDGGLPSGWKNRAYVGEGWFFPSLPYPHTYNYYVNDKERKAMLITSQFDFTGVVSATLALNHRVYAYETGWYNRIMVSPDKINWTIIQEYTVGWDPDGYRYEEFDITPAKSDEKLFLAFEINYPMLLPFIYEAVWEIDDITITVQNPPQNVTFVVEDEYGIPLNDAIITLDGITNTAGDYVFEEIDPGTYIYSIALAGYVTSTGEVTVVNQDIVETVVLYPPVIISNFPWVEGFDTGLPDGWQNVVNEGNGFAFAQNPYTHTYIYYFGDLQRNAMLVTPLLDLSGMETAKLGVFHRIYAYAQGWSHKILKSTDGVNWEVIAEFTEGFNPDINLYMEYDITPAKSDEMIYIAFAVDYPLLPDYYEAVWEIVDITVFEPIPTFNVLFEVEDDNGMTLPNAVVTFNGVTNAAGNYLFEEIEAGVYDYAVESEGYLSESGQVEVIDQDVTATVYLEKIGQLVELLEGWSLISSYQNPEANMLEEIFADQIQNQNLIIMLNQVGFFWPVNNINTLGNWNPYQGYKIKMNSLDMVNIQGEMLENLTVNLNQGVNYLPVLSKLPVESSVIFNQIAGDILYAFDLVKGFIYWPAGGLNNLEVLEPGMAYLVGMSGAATVTFPVSGGKAVASPQPVIVQNSPWMVEKTGSVHIISIAENSIEDGDIVAAFTSSGQCVGVAQKTAASGNLGLAVFGDDLTTQSIDGMNEFEPMSFRIFKTNTSEMIDVTPVWDFEMPNAGYFSENGLSAITAFKADATGFTNIGLASVNIYPNPANDFINIEIPDKKSTSVEILDQLGQLIIAVELDQDKTRVDVSNLRSGIYMLRVSDGNQMLSVTKLVVR